MAGPPPALVRARPATPGIDPALPAGGEHRQRGRVPAASRHGFPGAVGPAAAAGGPRARVAEPPPPSFRIAGAQAAMSAKTRRRETRREFLAVGIMASPMVACPAESRGPDYRPTRIPRDRALRQPLQPPPDKTRNGAGSLLARQVTGRSTRWKGRLEATAHPPSSGSSALSASGSGVSGEKAHLAVLNVEILLSFL